MWRWEKELSGISQICKTVDEKPHYTSITTDGKNFKYERTRFFDGKFVSKRLTKIGCKSSSSHKIGLTGGRNPFINVVNNASIDVNAEHLLNFILSNTEELEKKATNMISTLGEEYCDNIFSKGVVPESVKFWWK